MRLLARSTVRAIAKYGERQCVLAYRENIEGNGPNTIGGGDTRKGDSMIYAGRDLVTGSRQPANRDTLLAVDAWLAFNAAKPST